MSRLEDILSKRLRRAEPKVIRHELSILDRVLNLNNALFAVRLALFDPLRAISNENTEQVREGEIDVLKEEQSEYDGNPVVFIH
jgi:hypothetical protein